MDHMLALLLLSIIAHSILFHYVCHLLLRLKQVLIEVYFIDGLLAVEDVNEALALDIDNIL